MLYSWQCLNKMKKIVLFLFTISVLFLINFVSAIELGISPGNLVFNGNINEKICKNLTISTDYNGILVGESKWIEKSEKKRDIKDYDINADDLNINIEFSESININKTKEIINVCVTAEKPGRYNGAIIYKTADSYAGVGSWIEVDIAGIENKNPGSNGISGASIGIISKIPKEHAFIQSMLAISLITLFLVFAFLFIIYKKRY